MLKNKKSCRNLNIQIAFLIIMIITTVMPWFSIGSEVSSLWGITVAIKQYIFIPIVFLIFYIWELEGKDKVVYDSLAVIASIATIVLYCIAFIDFRKYMWTIFDDNAVIDFTYSFQCARLPFWISAASAVGFLVILLINIFLEKKNN